MGPRPSSPTHTHRVADFLSSERPIAVFRTKQRRSRYHRHEFTELVLITGGSGLHRDVQQDEVLVPGDVLCVLPGQDHQYVDTHGLSLINIMFDGRSLPLPFADLATLPTYQQLFAGADNPSQRQPGRLHCEPAQLQQVLRLVDALELELARRQPGFGYSAACYLLQILGILIRHGRVPAGDGLPEALAQVLAFMAEHFREDLDVAALARVGGCSVRSLQRLCVHHLGRSPVEHLLHLRMAEAAQLLRHSEARVIDVAMAVGFNDGNYFSRQFRRLLGISPRAYRQGMS